MIKNSLLVKCVLKIENFLIPLPVEGIILQFQDQLAPGGHCPVYGPCFDFAD